MKKSLKLIILTLSLLVSSSMQSRLKSTMILERVRNQILLAQQENQISDSIMPLQTENQTSTSVASSVDSNVEIKNSLQPTLLEPVQQISQDDVNNTSMGFLSGNENQNDLSSLPNFDDYSLDNYITESENQTVDTASSEGSDNQLPYFEAASSQDTLEQNQGPINYENTTAILPNEISDNYQLANVSDNDNQTQSQIDAELAHYIWVQVQSAVGVENQANWGINFGAIGGALKGVASRVAPIIGKIAAKVGPALLKKLARLALTAAIPATAALPLPLAQQSQENYDIILPEWKNSDAYLIRAQSTFAQLKRAQNEDEAYVLAQSLQEVTEGYIQAQFLDNIFGFVNDIRKRADGIKDLANIFDNLQKKAFSVLGMFGVKIPPVTNSTTTASTTTTPAPKVTTAAAKPTTAPQKKSQLSESDYERESDRDEFLGLNKAAVQVISEDIDNIVRSEVFNFLANQVYSQDGGVFSQIKAQSDAYIMSLGKLQ
eukprot:403364172